VRGRGEEKEKSTCAAGRTIHGRAV
jgi:hypothetical protein